MENRIRELESELNILKKSELRKFSAMCLQGLLSIYQEGNGQFPSIVPNEENSQYMVKLAITSAKELIKQLDEETK